MKLSKIFSFLKRKDETKIKINKENKVKIDEWGEPIKKPKLSLANTLTSFYKRVSSVSIEIQKPKFKLRFFLRTKRMVAGFLLFIFSIMTFMSFPNVVSIILFLNSAILLDYLLKTRKVILK